MVVSFSHKMAERSEAKSAEHPAEKTKLLIFEAKLCFALLASLRSAILSKNVATNLLVTLPVVVKLKFIFLWHSTGLFFLDVTWIVLISFLASGSLKPWAKRPNCLSGPLALEMHFQNLKFKYSLRANYFCSFFLFVSELIEKLVFWRHRLAPSFKQLSRIIRKWASRSWIFRPRTRYAPIFNNPKYNFRSFASQNLHNTSRILNLILGNGAFLRN